MNLRSKLLIPALLTSAMLLLMLAYMGYSRMRSQEQLAHTQRAQRVSLLESSLRDLKRNCRSVARFVAENPRVIDGLQTNNQDEVLDVLVPVHENLHYDLATVYDRDSMIIACASDPGVFGMRDEHAPLIEMAIREGTVTQFRAAQGRTTVVCAQRVETVFDSVGVALVSLEIAADDIAEIEETLHTRIELVGPDGVVLSSGTPIGSKGPPVSLDFTEVFDQHNSVQIRLYDEQAQERLAFLMELAIVLAMISIFAGWILRVSYKLVARTTAALEDAKVASDRATQAKSSFLANMSHEIRTPMTAILGFAENLLERDQTESDRLVSVYTIQRNGEYLIGIINDILDLSKIESGKMSVESIACEPCLVIAEVVSLLGVNSDAKGLQLTIEYKGEIPEVVQTDPTRLRQILINVVGNAIKFTEVGEVRIMTELVGDEPDPLLQFDIIDTGRGMTAEQVEELFQPFTQADVSTTRQFGGTGLGLTISKRFAEMLGGGIHVHSTELSRGTTFRVLVATGPLHHAEMHTDPMSATVVTDSTKPSENPALPCLQGQRILLAEDGPDNQRLISHVLRRAGATVSLAENGQTAIESVLAAYAEDEPFDCILMDMQMPVLDGYEATAELRRKHFTLPIIALTAHAMASDRLKCIDAGCNEYQTKPIDRTALLESIRQHCPTIA